MKTYMHQLQKHYPPHTITKQTGKVEHKFSDVLADVSKLKVSKHAAQRLSERNIEISKDKWQVINGKINEARALGVTDALVVTNEAALVVSAKNNIVITALNNQEASSKVFSNINGTILINE